MALFCSAYHNDVWNEVTLIRLSLYLYAPSEHF